MTGSTKYAQCDIQLNASIIFSIFEKDLFHPKFLFIYKCEIILNLQASIYMNIKAHLNIRIFKTDVVLQ